jgi:hypothetical protein
MDSSRGLLRSKQLQESDEANTQPAIGTTQVPRRNQLQLPALCGKLAHYSHDCTDLIASEAHHAPTPLSDAFVFDHDGSGR